MAAIHRDETQSTIRSSYQERNASAGLEWLVDRFWQATGSPAFPLDAYTILPDGCVDVVYEQQGSRVRCLAFGTTASAKQIGIVPDATYFGIRFQPGMARYVLRLSMPELTDTSLELTSFLAINDGEIAEANGLESRQRRLELGLTRLISRQNLSPTALDRAILSVQHRPAFARVARLADLCGLSPRQLERRVTESAGLSPKLLLRIFRVQAALAGLRRAPGQPLADLALDLGYTDQAHLNRDFRLLTGKTPTYFRTASTDSLQASNLISLTLSDFSKT